jgi:hypothetical protein
MAIELNVVGLMNIQYAIVDRRKGQEKVRSLQDYHADIR